MQQRSEGRRAVPVLPPPYSCEFEPDGLVVCLGGDEGERTRVLYFGPGWTVEAVEDAVYDYDRDLLDFGERFFSLWREVFPADSPREV